MLRLYYDKDKIVRLASTKEVMSNIYQCVTINQDVGNPIGKRLVFGPKRDRQGIRLAVICNWDSACGIATYTKYLVESLACKVDGLKIFSEKTDSEKLDSKYDISYCWHRGNPLRNLVDQVKDWKPDVVLIQHEYGIFPKTSYMLQMLQGLADIPYVVTMHSVYEHLDKTIASSSMKNIIVHTDSGKECLRRLGNNSDIYTIPHGCVTVDDSSELWNTWQTEYPIMQFGFGFDYKGVDVALNALKILKDSHGNKYSNVFYTYFCSESPHVKNVNDNYARKVQTMIDDLGLQDNALIVRGYQSEQTLSSCLRTSRMAIFPYVTDSKNVVYGASGAVRVAMANGVPVIASSSRMFDDMQGVLERPANANELATTIDKVFSDGHYRAGTLKKAAEYIKNHSWDRTAESYVLAFKQVMSTGKEDVIHITSEQDPSE